MKKLLLAILFAACLPSLSYAQQTGASSQLLLKFPNGYISPNGTQLNKMVDAINGGEICQSYVQKAAGNTLIDETFFVATRAMRVISISAVYSVTNGAGQTVQVVKDTGTNAPGAGTDLLTNNTNAGFDLNLTANTVQTGTLVTTAGVTNLAVGNRLAVDFSSTPAAALVGLIITVCLAPLQ